MITTYRVLVAQRQHDLRRPYRTPRRLGVGYRRQTWTYRPS